MTSPAPGVYLPGSQANPSARVSEAIGRPADRRTGTVVSFAAGVLTVSVGGGDPEDIGYINSYSPVVGDVVSLILQRSTWLCIGRLNDSTALLPPSTNSFQLAGVSLSTSSAVFIDMTSLSFAFTKRRPESRVFADFAGSGFTTVAGSGAEYALRIGGVDYSLAQFFWNAAAVHHTWTGFRHLTSIPAGVYTVQGRMRLYIGAGPVAYDPNDRMSMYCAEVD